MKCPKCGGDVNVFNTRNISDNRVGRQRSCRECKYCFVTVEEIAENDEAIRKEMIYTMNKNNKRRALGLKRYLMNVKDPKGGEANFEVSATSEDDAISVAKHYILRNYNTEYDLDTIRVVRRL